MKQKTIFNGYVIREDGRVYNRHGRPISMQVSKNGYIRVELWDKGRGKKHLLHRLLAQAFIQNPENKPQVNHIDGDKANNSLSNLEWSTQSENQLHAYSIGLQKGYRKPGYKLSPEHKKALCGSRWEKERHHYSLEGKTFNNLWDAADYFGVSRQTILNRCKSKNFPQWTKSIERRAKCQRS